MPKRTDISSILIIGAGSIIVEQPCEFDYSDPHNSYYLFEKFAGTIG